ncbi:HAD family hydrolase [Candidatus Macondimonas diazotrophica]|uniref:HAD family hydrolase n=1 Tax=Candidatus Macondimonas diazotrophica TaxID=2305248 RepID=A0A4Z0FBK9_9GAMM|nr:HAD family hydrolase [Candidatus Macondimonas diazotrophica]NCU00974.1 HAD family hydrolase [Candidatus Macondimonas diazotrophica]TFZ83207.1 HAD family hydrolase [Candidatus Macondimonas diazotrophica]
MTLALFDLDNTLLAGDSDHLWGDYLVTLGVVDGTHYRAQNQRFYDAYRAGTLDIHEFLAFALKPLADHPRERLEAWRERFVAELIGPIVLPAAQALVDQHRRQGHRTVIITATNRFVTEPIARLFGVDALIATDPEEEAGAYTGRVAGVPCYRDGKVIRLAEWLAGAQPAETWFYSDSHNDLPLLGQVEHPVAIDPDPLLEEQARQRGWPVLTLRRGEQPVPLPQD